MATEPSPDLERKLEGLQPIVDYLVRQIDSYLGIEGPPITLHIASESRAQLIEAAHNADSFGNRIIQGLLAWIKYCPTSSDNRAFVWPHIPHALFLQEQTLDEPNLKCVLAHEITHDRVGLFRGKKPGFLAVDFTQKAIRYLDEGFANYIADTLVGYSSDEHLIHWASMRQTIDNVIRSSRDKTLIREAHALYADMFLSFSKSPALLIESEGFYFCRSVAKSLGEEHLMDLIQHPFDDSLHRLPWGTYLRRMLTQDLCRVTEKEIKNPLLYIQRCQEDAA
ncbi:MAG TPA: hypothetical protein VJH22_06155 [Candidatus Nanoarchaeia archaeon]|nr:hypothetical protein [Candidatus Nanoarchaeia archaeon]